MTAADRQFVRVRADHRCEYCQLQQEDSPLAALHIEHIRPKKHGGSDSLDNLCLACIDCNLKKGPNLTGIDPVTDAITPLFHPRLNSWHEHFEWKDLRIHGRTAIGRATSSVLDLNADDRLDVRLA
jgi:5-methylcytosine-specific restriction endonuclease McrA